MKHLSIFMAALIVLLSLCVREASAWQITMTCGDGYEEEQCAPDQTPLPTYWPSPCLSYYLNETGTNQMAFSDVLEVVQKSIEMWNHPEISSLQLHYGGLTNEDRIGYNPYIDDNANIIVFRDDAWDESRAMIALTTVTHSRSTGVIYDADIEINSHVYSFGIYEKDGGGVMDLQNTLTHEIGHTFGLAHSEKDDATMHAYSETGVTSLRTLDQDDLDAIENIYPPNSKSCKFSKDDYFERPIYEMTEGPAPHSSDCSGVPMGTTNLWGILGFLGIVLCTQKKRRVLQKQ